MKKYILIKSCGAIKIFPYSFLDFWFYEHKYPHVSSNKDIVIPFLKNHKTIKLSIYNFFLYWKQLVPHNKLNSSLHWFYGFLGIMQGWC